MEEQVRRRRKKVNKGAKKVILLMVSFFLVIFAIQAYKYYQVYSETKKLETEIEQLREKNGLLEKQVEELKSPEAIEKVARDELGLVKTGEVPYVK